MTDYNRYMGSKTWENTREKALLRANGECQRCKAWNCTLEVHHRTYERLGRERAGDLEVLCKPCHEIADKERAEESFLRWVDRTYGANPPDLELLRMEYEARRNR